MSRPMVHRLNQGWGWICGHYDPDARGISCAASWDQDWDQPAAFRDALLHAETEHPVTAS